MQDDTDHRVDLAIQENENCGTGHRMNERGKTKEKKEQYEMLC